MKIRLDGDLLRGDDLWSFMYNCQYYDRDGESRTETPIEIRWIPGFDPGWMLELSFDAISVFKRAPDFAESLSIIIGLNRPEPKPEILLELIADTAEEWRWIQEAMSDKNWEPEPPWDEETSMKQMRKMRLA